MVGSDDVDLAYHCRLLLYNRPKHTKLYRWLGLYPLYLLAEVAVIATDLAELLGSAIALCLLFPRLEMWQAVLITAFDVVLILAMRDPLRGKPVRLFELLIAIMVGLAPSVFALSILFFAPGVDRLNLHACDYLEGRNQHEGCFFWVSPFQISV